MYFYSVETTLLYPVAGSFATNNRKARTTRAPNYPVHYTRYELTTLLEVIIVVGMCNANALKYWATFFTLHCFPTRFFRVA